MAPDGAQWLLDNYVGEAFLQEFRQSITDNLWAQASKHLHGAGAEDGIDLATAKQHLTALTKQGKHQEKGMLATSMAAGCWTKDRKYMAARAEDPYCTRCNLAPETIRHRLWECHCNEQLGDKEVQDTQH